MRQTSDAEAGVPVRRGGRPVHGHAPDRDVGSGQVRPLPTPTAALTPRTLLALQRAAGNTAVARHLAATPPEVAVQRVLSRGSGTGWGALTWVEGGQALWTRIDKGFNTDLIAVRDDLKEIVDGEKRTATTSEARRAFDSIQAFITFWEKRGKVYFNANPDAGQKISAAQLATQIEENVKRGRASVTAAKEARTLAETEPEADLVDDEALEEAPDLINDEPESSDREDEPERETPVAIHTPPSGAGVPIAVGSNSTTTPVVEAEPKPTSVPKVDVVAKKKPTTKKKKPSGPKPKSQAQIEEGRQKANAERKRQTELKVQAVKDFKTVLETRSSALIASEKINDFKFRQTWATDLEAIMNRATVHVRGGKSVQAALRIAYDSWTAILIPQRDANRLARRGNVAEWQMWTGLNDYRIVKDLPGAQFTPPERVPDPVQGPETADGTPPQEVPVETEAPTPIPIHVTYDLKSVRSPLGAVNGASVPALVSDVLSVSNVGWRVHGTLESPYGEPYPHVYWGGSDLGLGAGRYPQWNGVGAGWVPGPEGPSAKAKVQQVLDAFVATRVIPRVQGFATSFTYTEYDWPTFESLAPADPVTAEAESDEGLAS